MKYLHEIIAAAMVASIIFRLYGIEPALICLLVMVILTGRRCRRGDRGVRNGH